MCAVAFRSAMLIWYSSLTATSPLIRLTKKTFLNRKVQGAQVGLDPQANQGGVFDDVLSTHSVIHP